MRAAQQALPQITPAPDRGFPVQADGVRPSRALPYELHVSAHADATTGVVKLAFVNTGRAAAVFHVYDKLHLDRLPQRYMVEPGKFLDDAWAAQADDAGRYDLWLLGPNGFHRHFTGDLTAAGAPTGTSPYARTATPYSRGSHRVTAAGTTSSSRAAPTTSSPAASPAASRQAVTPSVIPEWASPMTSERLHLARRSGRLT